VSGALDGFFGHYYRRRPVNATFTGIHMYDELLPDWSLEGLEALDGEMHALARELGAAHPPPASAREYRDNADLLDAELARAFLEIQLAENAGGHGVRRNPALWTGEAIFSVIALMTRNFAPLVERVRTAAARLRAIPAFLSSATATLADETIPEVWTAKALRECAGAGILLERGVPLWLASGKVSNDDARALADAAASACAAFADFGDWLGARPAAPVSSLACGAALFDVLLDRGHQCARTRADLLTDARERFTEERARLDELASEAAGSLANAQAQLTADHPLAVDYLGAFERTWTACRERAALHDIVDWPVWPIRYVPFPAWTADAAPYLYYLYYRSPAPFDPIDGFYDYVVPRVPDDASAAEAHLRAWNHSVIKLNHVVHHGAIGHHVQNWHAYHRSRSRIGRIAAVDCASRIGMFAGGSMAEGWACYVARLMDEVDFLSPLERVSEQHSRVRFLGRAIVDIELHQGTMSFDDAVRFYAESVGIPGDAARGEAVKNSMFPCTAIMYWLGTRSILDLRDRVRAARGAEFSMREFHDELLRHGSIPVPLVARMMTEPAA
jgi:Bacterial protein of unknown function (DUF885)